MGQAISTTQFFLYGRKHFTKTGHMNHIKGYYKEPVQSSATIRLSQDGADGFDLTNKVVVVTGANSGLGKEVATYAACKGATVYMVCRSAERAEAARQEIVSASQNDNVKVLLADVAELAQVRNVAKELADKESKIHAIVCNAGVLLTERKESSEGNEVTFASHLLGGSYLLPHLLKPQVVAASGRVVIVTSGGMYNFKVPTWKYLSGSNEIKYNGFSAYSYAKRAQVVLAERLAETEPEIDWVTVHPGWADTNAVDEAFGDYKKWLQPLREPWEGAEGVAWLVATDKSNLMNGAFYLDRKEQPKHIAGPFFTEGWATKNKPAEIDEMVAKLKEAAGL